MDMTIQEIRDKLDLLERSLVRLDCECAIIDYEIEQLTDRLNKYNLKDKKYKREETINDISKKLNT